MKTCPSCRKEYPDEAAFCSADGASLQAGVDEASTSEPVSPATINNLPLLKSRAPKDATSGSRGNSHFYDFNGSYRIPNGEVREVANAVVRILHRKNLARTRIGLSNWGNNEDSVAITVARKLEKGSSEAIIDIQFIAQGDDVFLKLRHYNHLAGHFEDAVLTFLRWMTIIFGLFAIVLLLITVPKDNFLVVLTAVTIPFGFLAVIIYAGVKILLGRGRLLASESTISMGLRASIIGVLREVAVETGSSLSEIAS